MANSVQNLHNQNNPIGKWRGRCDAESVTMQTSLHTVTEAKMIGTCNRIRESNKSDNTLLVNWFVYKSIYEYSSYF